MDIIIASLALIGLALFAMNPCINPKRDKLTGDVMDENKAKSDTKCKPAQERSNRMLVIIMVVLVGVMIWQVVELVAV